MQGQPFTLMEQRAKRAPEQINAQIGHASAIPAVTTSILSSVDRNRTAILDQKAADFRNIQQAFRFTDLEPVPPYYRIQQRFRNVAQRYHHIGRLLLGARKLWDLNLRENAQTVNGISILLESLLGVQTGIHRISSRSV